MLTVTVRSILESLKAFDKGFGEIVICDNSDESIYKRLPSFLPTGYYKEGSLKLLRQPFPCLFSARETAAHKSRGDYIFCLDSHMLMGYNTLVDSVNFMERHQEHELGFGHPPLNWSHQHERSSRHDRDISVHELGDWHSKYTKERTITWKGMPWICRRKWFLDTDKGLNGYGALAKHHVSWGGGDMHIGTKPWLLGFKNWAIPTDSCIHIGPFPKVDFTSKDPDSVIISSENEYRYRLYSSSGNFPHTFGFLVSCYILGGEQMMNRNKEVLNKKFGKYLNTDDLWHKAMAVGNEERKWLNERRIMSFKEFVTNKPWEDQC